MKKNKGSALIMVLVTVALMITCASVIATRYNRVFFFTENSLLYDNARWYVDGIEAIIIKYMRDDFKKTVGKVYLGMNWAQENQVIPLDEATITGNVIDEQACLNINALNTPVKINGSTTSAGDVASELQNGTYPQHVFHKLLMLMGADDSTADTITNSAIDWIDADSETKTSVGAEDNFYLSNHVPHVTNQGLFYDKSELRQIRGMTPELYRRIEPMICALPTTDFKISINTLRRRQAPLLVALFMDTITIENALNALETRPEYGWDSSAGFFRTEGFESAAASMPGLRSRIAAAVTVNSYYFVANVLVSFDNEKFAFKTRFHRNADTNLEVYQRFIGELYE